MPRSEGKRVRSGSPAQPGFGGVSGRARALVIGAMVTAGLLMGFHAVRGAPVHPEPRPEITGETVVPAERYAAYPRIAAVYRQAAEIAPVLDGLRCYCECDRHSGHYSLLSCFESDHGAACDICLTEAAFAHQMTKEGRSLKEIRKAVDALYKNQQHSH
jgi:hypothetical protein